MQFDSRLRYLTAMVVLGTWIGAANAQMSGGGYGGMMGPGMMGAAPESPAAARSPQVKNPIDAHDAHALSDYIRQQRLTCMQCHAVTGGGFAPSFAQIARNDARHPDETGALQRAIMQGTGRMPGGLATAGQARVLSRLIVELAKPGH